ncbi:MAG: polyprenyl synthetase family protein [Thermodesulfobacteriota bacterium]|nr:polyprenyl synthetase family protein [Thermodesulfobacteriota bacterium]
MSDITQLQDVLNRYAGDLKNVEEHMETYLHSEVRLIPEVSNYLISSGGKRFRPLLLLIASDLCGYKGENHYPLSAVVEFIHTASLLHDDVVDHAETRRGKASANNIWGNSASVLVGDFLYSKSFKLMTDHGNFPIIKLLSTTTNTMAEGEVLQLTKCGDIDINEKDYLSIVEKKTAILISAACAVGGILADAPETEIGALTRFGMRLGMAFQITDDTLDYIAVEDEFGKAIGMDLKEGKITLPLIRTLKKCSPEEKNLIKEIIKSEDPDVENIRKIVSLINKYKGINYALNKAKSYIDEGKALLEPFEKSKPKTSFLTISDYIIERRL